jgi:hypothetical protein
MTTSVEKNEYERRIRRLQREELLALWEKIWARAPTGWPPGKAFEYLILRAFELEGAKVRYPFVVRWGASESDSGWCAIEQIDGAIHLEGLHALVESKDEAGQVNVEPIAKLRSQLMRRPASAIGVCFSVRGFTAPARLLANMMAPQTVLLGYGSEVDACMRAAPGRRPFSSVLRHKHRVATETGLVDTDVGLSEVPSC